MIALDQETPASPWSKATIENKMEQVRAPPKEVFLPAIKPDFSANRLLAALPDNDRRRILGQCELVDLAADDMLHEAGAPLRHAYFPTGGFICLVTPLEADTGLEVAQVGNEGMVGVSLVLSVAESALHHLAHGAGSALRIGAASFRREFRHSPALRRRLYRYVYVNLSQIAQTAACIRFHVLEARLARWLLTTQDRSHSDQFHATHEFLAHMLGVRRVGITKAATSLQKRRLISYSRGDIRILDRAGLEAGSCGCYVAANELYERILG